jgi:hypothetical protein
MENVVRLYEVALQLARDWAIKYRMDIYIIQEGSYWRWLPSHTRPAHYATRVDPSGRVLND